MSLCPGIPRPSFVKTNNMNIFLTGATGFVGSAILPELLRAGHQVTGLARNEESAAKLRAAGAGAHLGDLHDLQGLLKAVRASDAVIHTAFIHDFSQYLASARTDTAVVEAMGAALAGSDRPLVITSGIGILASGGWNSEDNRPAPGLPGSPGSPRLASEAAIDRLAAQGIRASVVRLPPSVHDLGDHGFLPTLINIAREKQEAAYVGDGSNRWPAVHRSDAAKLYRLAIEKGTAGARYHAIGDKAIPMKEIAGMISRKLGVPLVSKSGEEAAGHFGWISGFVGMDVPSTATITQQELGWKPTGPGLLEDLEKGDYFN